VDTFIEIGPGRTLAGFNKKIAKAIDKELTTYTVGTMEDIDKVAEALK
jgi:[acyl-carrier-protein] S-malonyltransferase